MAVVGLESVISLPGRGSALRVMDQTASMDGVSEAIKTNSSSYRIILQFE